MRYGVCTWVFGDEPLPALAQRAAAMGLDGLELFCDLSLNPRKARKILDDRNLVALSMTPDNVDLCHPDPTIHRAARDYYFRLIDFAAEAGAPIVACHGQVGRVSAIRSQNEEWSAMVAEVQKLAARAAQCQLRIAIELLNRYESHLLNTAAEGLRFLREVGAVNVGLLLDTYHMNIEEANLPNVIETAQDHLFLFHIADSNRQAVGCGHIDFHAVARALRTIDYRGDIVFECTATGPDPFTAIKGSDSRAQVESFVRESFARIKVLEQT